MLKRFGIYVASAALICASTACNESDDNYEISLDYSSTQVTSFSLRSDSKVLNNLDSVFFSIDLVNGQIFNADSLPYGTKTDRLLVDLTTDGCSTVEIHFPKEDGKGDSIVDYITNKNDSIDFSRGPVRLHLISYDKIESRDYYIKVNVHTTVSDSLLWDLKNPAQLPTSLTDIKAQRTVEFNNRLYTLTTDGTSNACMSIADSPVATSSDTGFTFPFTPQVNTLTATTTSMYILDEAGALYSSVDGTSWTSCGKTWKSITAPYGTTLVGIAEIGGKLTHVTHPDGATSAVSPDFPVSGNSVAIPYSTDWGVQPQIITIGGLKADGTPTPTAWAYDGNRWACIAAKTPMKASGITVFPYYCCRTDTNTWIASTRSVLVAMGGRESATKMQDTVYISYDLGFNWAKAPSTMQIPKGFPLLYDAQVYVNTEEKHSRAIKPITEWDTPYIYMYGGYTSTDALMPRVYRGVINRLQFKPLQ